MKDNNLAERKAKKAAFIIGIINFLGFSGILFIPQVYMMGLFTPYIIFGQLILFTPVGLLESFILGWVIYFIFKHIKSKSIYIISLIVGIIICFPLGFFSNVHLFRFAMGVKSPEPIVIRIDANSDGKVDKWIHEEKKSKTIEIDTNYDGVPDIKEYYQNGKLVKKEIVDDSDGKLKRWEIIRNENKI